MPKSLKMLWILMCLCLLGTPVETEARESKTLNGIRFMDLERIASICNSTEEEVIFAQQRLFAQGAFSVEPDLNNCVLRVGIQESGVISLDPKWIWKLATMPEHTKPQTELLRIVLRAPPSQKESQTTPGFMLPLCYFLVGTFPETPSIQVSALGYLKRFDPEGSLAFRSAFVPRLSESLREKGWDLSADGILSLAE